MTPDLWQVILLWAAGICFAVAFFSALKRVRTQTAPTDAAETAAPILGPVARFTFALGTLIAIGLVAWRVLREDNRGAGGPNSPLLFNFFDLFLLLGILLAAISVYFRITRRLRSLTFFLLPIISLVLLVGGLLGLLYTRTFKYDSVTLVVHVVTIMISLLLFALGCVGGVVYLLADRQLKKKGLTSEHRLLKLPSLASLERFNLHVVLAGFPLLTIAIITGGIILGQHPSAGFIPKIILAVAAWLIYGILIHIPLAPSFRGRRAAWLIIVGFPVLLSVFFLVKP